jgi:hypothetical protein
MGCLEFDESKRRKTKTRRDTDAMDRLGLKDGEDRRNISISSPSFG